MNTRLSHIASCAVFASAVVAVLLSGTACLKNSPINLEFEDFEPVAFADGHTLSTPSAEGMDSAALVEIYRDVYADENLWSLRSLLVFRNGKLVSEAYLKDPEDLHTPHFDWSCTKQFMGGLAGIALEEGLFSSLDDPLSAHFDTELDGHPDKADITIRNLITMQSGIDYSNIGETGQTDKLLKQIPDNSVDFVLSRPMEDAPGEAFHYKDGDPHLLSALIQKKSGMPTDEWADDLLFSKIGLNNYRWDRYKDGVTLGGFGIVTTPREMAKYALCIAAGGSWDGEQVIPASWVDELTSFKTETGGDFDFGYLWWIDPSRDLHFMWGAGGQFAFIVPSKQLVVVMSSLPYTGGDYEIQADEALPVVDRIIDTAD